MRSHGALPALLAVVPHGIFELPAILLAAGMGLWLGGRAIIKVVGRSQTSIASETILALTVFVRIVVPLLIIAALVESFLTSALVAA
jgi:stage II sporulation protein M